MPVLLISLDGATFDVLEPLAAAGEMPAVQALMAKGAWGPLSSVIPPITPTAWSSFMTGKQPGKHGVLDFRLYDPSSYRDTFITSRALREPTLWELLTAAGCRVGVVGLPMMYPPKPGSGTVVTGFDTPSVDVPFTNPPELQARILERFPDYQFVAAPPAGDPNVEGDDSFDEFITGVERSFTQRAGVALDLLADGAWDALMVHFQDTDAMQHRVWRFIAEPRRNPARWARIRQVYRHLDTQIGRLISAASDDALIVILSDHGFGSLQGHLNPNVLLQRWGYLDWYGRRIGRLKRSLRKRLLRLGLVRAPSPRGGPWVAEMRTQDFERMLPLRWRRTRAYVAIGHMYGQLFVNLRGREPKGTVAPGAERDALLRELQERFLAVRDPVDDAPVLAAVPRGEDVYPDDRLGRRPDLILIPASGYQVSRQLNFRMWISRYRLLSGTHRPQGVFVAAGPGIRPGRVEQELGLIDVAPTVLAHLGVAIPNDTDGRVLSELFVEPPVACYAAVEGKIDDEAHALSDAEEAQLAERLRSLGYMD